MKSSYIVKISIVFILAFFSLQGCENMLEEPVYSQFASGNLLSNKQGLVSVLADAYGRNNGSNRTRNIVKRGEMTTDILWQTGGGENGTAGPLIGFRWDASSTLEAFCWMEYWEVIRDANIIMENIENASGFSSDTDKTQLMAEAKFLRVWAYYQLWNQYGPLPIRMSQSDPLELPKATTEVFAEFMETQLLEVIPDLPAPGMEPAYGRVHSAGAQGLLCEWYLNNHEWQKCADIAEDIILSEDFSLVPSYTDLFALENEENSEFILVKTKLANQGNNTSLFATAAPWGYKVGLDGGLNGVVNEQWANFASQYRLYDEFYYSFDPQDERKSRILTKYINSTNDTVNLLTDYTDATRGMKYPPDPEGTGSQHGNDVPMIRYADILLSRAEALNELSYPNQESIDLINEIRNRAGLTVDLLLANFPSKEAVREQILKERRWEFWYEGKRRRDLIRMGKFIENAHDRGITNATDNHVWFPIPQSAIDANPLLVQNTGF
jgi:starch-binding outer membrane protein, SusD/RagB family